MERAWGSSRLLLPDGDDIRLEYFMLENSSSDSRLRTYGIGIRKIQNGEEETEQVEKVTESESKARKWLSILMRNQVTPLCLAETLDDFITAEGV